MSLSRNTNISFKTQREDEKLQHLASVNLQVILNIFIEHQIYQKYNLQKRVIQLTFTHAQEPNGGKTAC